MNKKSVVIVAIAVAACLLLAISAYFALESRTPGVPAPSGKTASGTLASTWSVETAAVNAYDEAVASWDVARCAVLPKGKSDKCSADILTDGARRAFNSAPCGKIPNRLLRADCVKKVDEYVSAYAPDVKSCGLVKNETLKNECSDRVNLALASQGDARACEALVNQSFKTSCADSYLVHQVDTGKSPASACRRLSNKSLVDSCLKMGEAAFLRNGSVDQ